MSFGVHATVFTHNSLLCLQKRIDVFAITMKQTMGEFPFIVEFFKRLNSKVNKASKLKIKLKLILKLFFNLIFNLNKNNFNLN